MALLRFLSTALALFPVVVAAQGTNPDLADSAPIAAFQRDSGNVVCAQKNASLQKMRALLVKCLRNVIAHGNGDGSLTRNKYVEFEKDRNGDLQIILKDAEGFVSIVSDVARELVGHANKAADSK